MHDAITHQQVDLFPKSEKESDFRAFASMMYQNYLIECDAWQDTRRYNSLQEYVVSNKWFLKSEYKKKYNS